MSSRPLITPHLVLTNASMATSLTSQVTIVSNISMLSYQAVWSAGATPIGTMDIQASNDYSINMDGSVRNAGSWSTLPITQAVSGNSGTGFFDIEVVSGYAYRLIYTRVSGTATLNVTIVGKVT